MQALEALESEDSKARDFVRLRRWHESVNKHICLLHFCNHLLQFANFGDAHEDGGAAKSARLQVAKLAIMQQKFKLGPGDSQLQVGSSIFCLVLCMVGAQ